MIAALLTKFNRRSYHKLTTTAILHFLHPRVKEKTHKSLITHLRKVRRQLRYQFCPERRAHYPCLGLLVCHSYCWHSSPPCKIDLSIVLTPVNYYIDASAAHIAAWPVLFRSRGIIVDSFGNTARATDTYWPGPFKATHSNTRRCIFSRK